MTRIDPRKQKSREKLHEAYLILKVKGLDHFTIQHLCDEAHVTRPTFYKLYKDIQQLRLEVHETVLKDLKAALVIGNPKPLTELSSEELLRLLTTFFEHIKEKHYAYEAFFVSQPDALFIYGVKEIVGQYVLEGVHYIKNQNRTFRVDTRFFKAYLTGAYLEMILFWINDNYEKSPREMAKDLFEISFYGPYLN
ncbi:TetR/AcrR family transcriptional regulator [Bacillus testis]|uniref:TetR/AcrR family transcriptional regulator n=1 Tax=Bacillus testis TaxID=1622072 RepID=UPI00067F6CD3|nr:TetR-like C-terminal domain-containing protein [Bacillus testis]